MVGIAHKSSKTSLSRTNPKVARLTMQRSYQLEPGWKVDNMRVIVSMLTTLDGGKTYTCNNVNECKLGESADYLYNE